jgi:hypothetical protein
MRPRPYMLLVLLFLLPGISFSFTASDYFYSGEEVTVTGEEFVLDGDDYEILFFNGEETFLLKNGAPVNDSEEISRVLHDYYREKYYPSDEDLQEVKDLIAAFNESRNDGYDWRDKEEYVCREILFTDKRIMMDGEPVWCHDDESCYKNALLVYSAYSRGMGWGSYDVILQPLKDFSYASYGLDFILGNMTTKLETMEDDEVVETFDYIDESIPTMRDYIEDIESTMFRTPRLNDSADREACNLVCYGMCPSFDLDENILDELDSKVEELSEGIGPFAEYETTASRVYDNTGLRLSHYLNVTTASQYDTLFAPLDERGTELEEYADEASSLVSNTSFMIKLERLKELRTTIRGNIDGNNFETLDEDMETYAELLDEVQDGADHLYSIYNETADAKNNAEMLLFEIGTKDLGPLEEEKFNELRNMTSELDDEFQAGLTASQLDELEANYSEISKDAVRLLGSIESTGTSQAIVYFRGFARRLNGGIAQFAETTNITNVQDIPENQFMTLGGFSFLVFLSLASLALLFFLYILRAYTHSRIKLIVVTGFVVSMLLVGAFAISLFFFMQKTSTDATMDEFLVDFKDRETAAIVVDASLLTTTEYEAVAGCADKLAESIRSTNKSVHIYTLKSDGRCTKSYESHDESLDEEACLSDIGESDSVIYLKPSNTIEEPQLYTTYLSKAEIYATADYYHYCPLSTLFE